MTRPLLAAALLAATLAAAGCGVKQMQRSVTSPAAVTTVDGKSPFLKVHMRDGSLYVLSPWSANDTTRIVRGKGTLYAANRTVVDRGDYIVPIDSVALFETNVSRQSPAVGAMAVVTGISVAVSIACLANPKACFGSCPTFYVTDGATDLLQAEGFSASIAPSLEARDVDALFRARPTGREVRIDMVNEAYETHVIRYANLLAVPRAPGGRVLKDESGAFWTVSAPVSATRCTAPEGDCGARLAAYDQQERWSASDSTDLATRETIDLTFANAGGVRTPALALASRQSLLPTYLLYQAFAYIGSRTGDWLGMLERTGGASLKDGGSMVALLGGVDVLVANGAGGWDSVATIRETGPLASDLRLIRLPANARGDTVRVRLRMAKGAWRVDWAALTDVERPIDALRLAPRQVLTHGRAAPDARAQLTDSAQVLVTYPGDRYTLVYALPDDASRYELFLESRGYYLEWMREEWIAETSARRATALFRDPAGSLRRLAPEYKAREAELDSTFWRSKYAPR